MGAAFDDEMERPISQRTVDRFERCGEGRQDALRALLADYPTDTDERQRNREVLESVLSGS